MSGGGEYLDLHFRAAAGRIRHNTLAVGMGVDRGRIAAVEFVAMSWAACRTRPSSATPLIGREIEILVADVAAYRDCRDWARAEPDKLF